MIPGIWELLDYVANTVNNLNLTFVWSYQNAPRMDKPYVMIDYTNDDLPNFGYIDPYIDANGFQEISSWRKATINLQFFCGPNSDQIASQMAMMLGASAALDKQMLLDVAIGDCLMFQRIPALLNNSQYEDRTIYQFDYYYTDHYKDNVGLIETVVVEGHYTGSLTDQMCIETITFSEFTRWDQMKTRWDNGTTNWDKK